MAMLPYADVRGTDVRELVDKIVAERGSVLHLYQMLLHSPPIAEGWLALLTAVRHKASLPGGLRELAIMRVAVLNGATYEAEHHAPIAIQEGIAPEQLVHLHDWSSADVYDGAQRATLALTDSMTRDIRVPNGQFDDIRAHLNERQTVELVATIAAYNMVSRFLEALNIRSDDVR